jgi:hypothetical protein
MNPRDALISREVSEMSLSPDQLVSDQLVKDWLVKDWRHRCCRRMMRPLRFRCALVAELQIESPSGDFI